MERFVAEFARHRDRLFAYVYSLLPRREDAEDVFQRTSVVLWQKVGTWETGVDFLSWACGVAFYEVRNFLRVSGRDRLRFGDALLERLAQERAATLATRDERVAALEGCLRALDAAERELVRRAYGDDLSVRALAGESGKAAQTLYNRLNQIRRKLFECVSFKTSEART
ncbi:MAG TPA: sigma-70 family RNA polymerase sigma factor [Planctomycetota bacterium]